MADDLGLAREANENLKARRRELGLPETAKATRTTLIRETGLIGDTAAIQKIMADTCWKHADQKRPCPICQRGELEQDEDEAWKIEAGRAREEEHLRQAAQQLHDHPEEAMQDAGVGRRYLACSLDNFRVGERYVEICRNCAKNPHDLVLWGASGGGKTHLAVGILREIVRRGDRAHFVTVPELLLEIRGTFQRESGIVDTETDIINRYSTVPLLVLDDIGAEKSTPWSITTLYLIIDRRYREERPTIITSNLSPEQIEQDLSPRIASRLAGMTIGQVSLPDYRKRRQGATV